MKLAFATATVSMPRHVFYNYLCEKLQKNYELNQLSWRSKNPSLSIRKNDAS